MIEKEFTIASDFPPVSYDQWRASVVTDPKGVPFEKKLGFFDYRPENHHSRLIG